MISKLQKSGTFEKPGFLSLTVVWRMLAGVAVSVIGLGVLLASVQAQDEVGQGTEAAFAPGEIIVGWRATEVNAAAAAAEVGATVVQSVDMAGLDGGMGDAGVTAYLLAVPVGTELQAIDQLLADPAVALAEPNWIVRAAESYAEQPFSVNDPLYVPDQWYLQRIHASRGWQIGAELSQGGQPMRVAVVDSGIDALHPELKERVLEGRSYVFPLPPTDDGNGHGTHIAGLIGATVDNGAGMAGTAPNVRLVPYKVLNSAGAGTVSAVAQGIRDAANDGNPIINLSLELKLPSVTLEAAVNYAAGKGSLLIGAAGNCFPQEDTVCPPPVKYPAAYNAVMAVAATGFANELAPYSAVGNTVEIAAPGGADFTGMLSTWPAAALLKCERAYRIVDGGSYCEAQGTSMAAAVVTGVAAQVWSVRPDLTAGEVRALLRGTAARLPYSSGEVGAGLVNAQAAMLTARPSMLQVSPQQIGGEVAFGAGPFTRTVTLTNPSLEPISWEVTGTAGVGWLMLPNPVSGTVRYGERAQTSVTISPTHLFTGTYASTLYVGGTKADGSITFVPVNAQVAVRTLDLRERAYVPALNAPQFVAPGWPLVGFTWEQPGSGERTEYAMVDNSSIGITIPFTLPFMDKNYVDLRIFSDGYVALPAASAGAGLTVRCLGELVRPETAIFGWWGDLDPSAGGHVATFVTGAGRFVVEFEQVKVKGTGLEPARVSFQIVLYPDGHVGINYFDTPANNGITLPAVTVGLQARDGRFYNQVVCGREEVLYGRLPTANQSYLFTPEDLF